MLSIIVALSENNVIGTGNRLPWKISADLRRLKNLTMGHHLLMGRKTFESIGRPLPGRVNIIITRNENFKAEGCVVTKSMHEALEVSRNDSETFVFGGGEIFREAISLVRKIYMTRVHAEIAGDTFFPVLNPDEWKEVSREDHTKDEHNEYDYSFITYDRVK